MNNQTYKVKACCAVLLVTVWATNAATVSWVGGSGDWNTATNWSTGSLPGTNDNVVIGAGASITITHSSGTHTVSSIQCQQAFVLSGGSLTVSNTFQASNTITVSGGTLTTVTVVTTSGISLVVNGSGTLNGVTVNGTLDVGNTYNASLVTIVNGLVLNGTALVGNPTNSQWGGVQFSGSQTLGGGGTVVFGVSACNALQLVSGGTTLTIGSGITVRGQYGQIGYDNCWGGPQNVSVINQGTISADVGGGTITVVAQPFTNQGLAQGINGGSLFIDTLQNSINGTVVVNGGTLTLNGSNGSWTNTGTINATNATVSFGGTLTTVGSTLGNLGNFNRSGGTVNVTCTLVNTDSTLALNAATGPWVLTGGDIQGGTIMASSVAPLIISSGTLDGVTVNGNWDVGATVNGASLTVLDGLTNNGTLQVGNPTNQWYGRINFSGSQTLGGGGTVVFGVSACNALQLVSGGTTLTIGSGITVRGQYGQIGYDNCWGGPQNVSVINQGTISADVGGGTITVVAQPFTNQGNLNVAAGATLNPNGSLSFNDPNFLSIQVAGTLQVHSNLLGNAHSANLYSPLGTTLFNGSGTAALPQLLEAMGQDLGPLACIDHRVF